MTDVAGAFEAAGCRNVRTVIASGNVLFDGPAPTDALRRHVRRGLAALIGGEPVVVYRTVAHLEALLASNPFGAMADDRLIKLYVAFVAERTRKRPAFPLTLPKEALEAIGLAEGDVLIVSRRKPNGMYGFPNNWIERELEVMATARNWATVRRVVEVARSTP